MKDSRPVQVLAGLVTLAGAGVIYYSLGVGTSTPMDSRAPAAVGMVMARQAANLAKEGKQIIVITRDTTSFRNPATDIQLASFKKELRRSGLSVGTVQALQLDPLRPVEVPPGDFLELIRNSPKGSVIVSFMGPPLLNEAQRKQLGEIKPSIVAFCSGSLPDQVDLRATFDQGLLHAAVVSRRRGSAPTTQPADLQGWFDRSYLAITSANLASLPPRQL